IAAVREGTLRTRAWGKRPRHAGSPMPRLLEASRGTGGVPARSPRPGRSGWRATSGSRSSVMPGCNARFGLWFRVLVTVVILTGGPFPARAQDAPPGRIGPFRAGFDPLETTLTAKTELAIDRLPRKLAVKKLAESHGIRIKLNE